MGFKENLKAKMDLDRLLRTLLHTTKEPPQTRWVDKDLTKKILQWTDFEYQKSGSLDLYTRLLEDGTMEVLVMDNELPIYHTTVADVSLRRSPHWKDVFSLRNIRRIMNDQDVLVSKGKDSLRRLYGYALGRLDFTYRREDLAQLVEDARQGLKERWLEPVWESLELFVELLGFQPVYLEIDPDLQMFGRPSAGLKPGPVFEHLVILNRAAVSIGLRKGHFSTGDPSDLEWAERYAEGLERTGLSGAAVFEFLAELALAQQQYPPPLSDRLPGQIPTDQPRMEADRPRLDA